LRPTALIVSGDSIAVQVYAALREMGLRVARDVSLISFNYERPLVAGLVPSLTTLDTKAEEIGRRAVHQLLWQIRNQGECAPTKILLDPKIVIGNSVADLNR
jgi:LacI family transcriptional regulator